MTSPEAPQPDRRPSLALLAGLLLVATVGGWLGHLASLSTDEAFTIHSTSRGVAYAWTEALRFELQPPLYFTLASLWRAPDRSIEFTRLLSTLCIGLMLPLLTWLSREYRIGGRWWDLGLLAALTPSVLWASAEARVYALAMLLSAATLLAAARLWPAEGKGSPRAALGFVAGAAVQLDDVTACRPQQVHPAPHSSAHHRPDRAVRERVVVVDCQCIERRRGFRLTQRRPPRRRTPTG